MPRYTQSSGGRSRLVHLGYPAFHLYARVLWVMLATSEAIKPINQRIPPVIRGRKVCEIQSTRQAPSQGPGTYGDLIEPREAGKRATTNETVAPQSTYDPIKRINFNKYFRDVSHL